MMPSHSMDLPVPRGTSILVLDGKRFRVLSGSRNKQNDGDWQTYRAHVCVTCSKYVSVRRSCFICHGKSSLAASPTVNCTFFASHCLEPSAAFACATREQAQRCTRPPQRKDCLIRAGTASGTMLSLPTRCLIFLKSRSYVWASWKPVESQFESLLQRTDSLITKSEEENSNRRLSQKHKTWFSGPNFQ